MSWGSTLAVSNESGTAFTGTHGLALDISCSGYPAAGESSKVAGLTQGSAVSYEVWAPSGAGVTVSPMILDGNWSAVVLPARSLAAGWNAVSFTLPSGVGSVHVLGLQVNDGSGWAGRLVLDSVSF